MTNAEMVQKRKYVFDVCKFNEDATQTFENTILWMDDDLSAPYASFDAKTLQLNIDTCLAVLNECCTEQSLFDCVIKLGAGKVGYNLAMHMLGCKDDLWDADSIELSNLVDSLLENKSIHPFRYCAHCNHVTHVFS